MMPFSEQIKLEVKQKAAFRCCRCQSIGVEVHHIVPENDDGNSDMENAAPLCPSCHDYFGNNPSKRKEITQMKDWWYTRASLLVPNMGLEIGTLNQINDKLNSIMKQQADVSELKSLLRPIADQLINNMTAGTAAATSSGIVSIFASTSVTVPNASTSATAHSASTSGSALHAHTYGSGYHAGASGKCPVCGASLY